VMIRLKLHCTSILNNQIHECEEKEQFETNSIPKEITCPSEARRAHGLYHFLESFSLSRVDKEITKQ
jgi:hypothetical protein